MSNSLASYHAKWVKDDRSYHDIFWIMQHYLNIGWADLQTKSLDDFEALVLKNLEGAILDYLKGKPLAYIIGHVEFYQLPIHVTEGVLIPRRDTEPMVKEIISRLSGNEKILELGVGSGAISCAIAFHKPSVKIVAIDQSEVACKVAKDNARRLGLSNIDIIHDSWHDFSQSNFDWVISNPPYIDKDDPSLSKDVKAYEPHDALISEEEGYGDLSYIVNNSDRWLTDNGSLALEHGYLQQKKLKVILEQKGFKDILLGQDESHPRFVIAT